MENISCDDDDDDDDQIGILLLLNNSIPQDVLIQILVLLPVISLLRFKSVCKSWRALIQSSLFIHLHLNTTTTNNKNNNLGTFIFQTSESYIGGSTTENEAFMLSGGGGGGGGGEKEDGEKLLLKWENLGFPPGYKVSPGTHDDILMVGSCNGLICIHDTKGGDVSLWNPATRQFRLLPKSLNPFDEEEEIPGYIDEDFYSDFVAFGYDVQTKDYKVVQISHFRPYNMSGDHWISVKEYIFRVQVYSLSTDSWRLLEGINSLPAFPWQAAGLNHGVYLKGSYYFLGLYGYEFDTQVTTGSMILSFDFTKEIFTTIQLPHDYTLNTILTCLGEKQLAVFTKIVGVKEEEDDDESDLEFYNIWALLNEHSVKEEEEESWTKLHSNVPYSLGRPRGISNNGEFALIATGGSSLINGEYVFSDKRLMLFNLVTKEVKKEFPTGNEVIRADVYKQSLVSIGGMNVA